MNFDDDHIDPLLRVHCPRDWDQYRRGCESTMMETYNNDALELGFAGEAGEVIDCIKKLEYHRHKIDVKKVMHQLKLELGDLMWYMTLLGWDGSMMQMRKNRPSLVRIKNIAKYAVDVDLDMCQQYVERIMSHYRLDPLEILALNRQKLLARYKSMT